LPDSSTKGREKRWTLNHPQSVLTNVLHPSVELTAQSGQSEARLEREANMLRCPLLRIFIVLVSAAQGRFHDVIRRPEARQALQSMGSCSIPGFIFNASGHFFP